MKKELWLCEVEEKNGKPFFKRVVPVEPDDIPNVIVIEKGEPEELNMALEYLAKNGFELLDVEHKHHNDFYSSFCATLINRKGGKFSGLTIQRKGTTTALNRAIH